MSLESRALVGSVDSINGSGARLIDIDARSCQDGDEVFVKSNNCYYVVRVGGAFVVDNDIYVTAKNLSSGQWVRSIDVDLAATYGDGGLSGYQTKRGTALTNANQTLQPGTDRVSEYVSEVTLTANRTKTLGTTSVITGATLTIYRADSAAFTLAIINGGTNGGTMFTFAASPPEVQGATFFYNGVDWVLASFQLYEV